jgi:hypothetical protein
VKQAVVASDPAGNRTTAQKVSSIEVRNHGGELLGRVPPEKVDELVTADLVSPITTRHGQIKYLLLNRDEPTLELPWRGGCNTTERIRNERGITIGAPKSGLQHKSLRHKTK